MPTKSFLLDFRNKINHIDKNIVELLAKRKNLIIKIAQSKIENNQSIRDIEREKKILQKLISLGKKYHLKSNYITQLFQLIIEESVLTQKKLLKKFYDNNQLALASFAFLGPKGSYSYIAANKYAQQEFKTFIKYECSTFSEIILSVENNKADYAILPIENTCSGFISEICYLLKKTELFIIGEINVLINHCLLSINNIKLYQIKNIYSHAQPFQQCSNFIKQFPEWKIHYTKSTTDAMKKIIQYNKMHNVALGSEVGGKIYGLNILAKNLANNKKNITRFIILNKHPVKISEDIPTKITLIFSINVKSTDLDRLLLIFKEKNIIIKKLNFQNTLKNLWEEIFYIEIQENLSSLFMKNALTTIKKNTKFFKILGCYPCANKHEIIS